MKHAWCGALATRIQGDQLDKSSRKVTLLIPEYTYLAIVSKGTLATKLVCGFLNGPPISDPSPQTPSISLPVSVLLFKIKV